MRTIPLETGLSLFIVLNVATLTTSIGFLSVGWAQIPPRKDEASMLLVTDNWQSDQMDVEYPTEKRPKSRVHLKYWTPGDHLDAAKRYEEEARLLVLEVRCMKLIENPLRPNREIETMKRADIFELIPRNEQEAQEKNALASIHQKVGLTLMVEKEKALAALDHPDATEGSAPQPNPYLNFQWIKDQAILG